MTKAEIRFEVFPCDLCATEASKVLGSIDGVIQVSFNSSVCRATVLFDPERVNIPIVLSALEPICSKSKVISVISPMKEGVFGDLPRKRTVSLATRYKGSL